MPIDEVSQSKENLNSGLPNTFSKTNENSNEYSNKRRVSFDTGKRPSNQQSKTNLIQLSICNDEQAQKDKSKATSRSQSPRTNRNQS